jgi:hypothetical protein
MMFPQDDKWGRWFRDGNEWFYQGASGILRAQVRADLFDRSQRDPLWGISQAEADNREKLKTEQ